MNVAQQLYSESLFTLGPEVRRLVADLDAANQDRQVMAHDLEVARARIADQEAELVALRAELEQARIQLGFVRATPAVTGRSLPEVVEELGRNLAAFPSVFADDEEMLDKIVVADPDAPRAEVTRG